MAKKRVVVAASTQVSQVSQVYTAVDILDKLSKAEGNFDETLDEAAFSLACWGLLDEMVYAVHGIAKANGVSTRGEFADIAYRVHRAQERQSARRQRQYNAEGKKREKDARDKYVADVLGASRAALAS
jgi:hypothetical protein